MFYAIGHHLPYFRRVWIAVGSQLGGVIHFSRDHACTGGAQQVLNLLQAVWRIPPMPTRRL
jgi:hypothetical protein